MNLKGEKMKFEEYKYILPAFWASPLINDDYTGLSDEEETELNTFLEKTASERGDGHWVLEDNEPSFCKHHDAQPYGVLAVDCLEFKWMKRQEKKVIKRSNAIDCAEACKLNNQGEKIYIVEYYDGYIDGHKYNVEELRFGYDGRYPAAGMRIFNNIDEAVDLANKLNTLQTKKEDLLYTLKIYKKDVVDEKVYQNYAKAAFAKIVNDENGEYVEFLICPQ